MDHAIALAGSYHGASSRNRSLLLMNYGIVPDIKLLPVIVNPLRTSAYLSLDKNIGFLFAQESSAIHCAMIGGLGQKVVPKFPLGPSAFDWRYRDMGIWESQDLEKIGVRGMVVNVYHVTLL
jgi:hypothetical protein